MNRQRFKKYIDIIINDIKYVAEYLIRELIKIIIVMIIIMIVLVICAIFLFIKNSIIILLIMIKIMIGTLYYNSVKKRVEENENKRTDKKSIQGMEEAQ